MSRAQRTPRRSDLQRIADAVGEADLRRVLCDNARAFYRQAEGPE